MKYCPRCGSLIEGSINCIECGFIIKENNLEKSIKNISIITDNSLYSDTIRIDDREYRQIKNNCTYKISTRHNE